LFEVCTGSNIQTHINEAKVCEQLEFCGNLGSWLGGIGANPLLASNIVGWATDVIDDGRNTFEFHRKIILNTSKLIYCYP
jgi:hypothetical protein